MKSILSLVLYTATALAQGIYIESPAAGTELKAGETITVQIGRPGFPENIAEIGIAIGIESCSGSSGCTAPDSAIGNLLYSGPYDPQSNGPPYPYENFTVTVPDVTGPAQIGVVRPYLVGLSYEFVVGTAVMNVTIV
ncbi:hypothetical protein AtubIFM55763_003602 [Aspergillus tubingensis]|nr:hypothetical protein AtubIFM55763_003602 [Aspergillus tubingensis]GLB17380.1 hypothetical protein AtubIFM61612_007248 [Aspergillus tubingensis]